MQDIRFLRRRDYNLFYNPKYLFTLQTIILYKHLLQMRRDLIDPEPLSIGKY